MQVAEAVSVVHFLPIVVTEGLFVDVAEQVKRFNAHIGSMKAALQQRPKVLNSVGVSVSVHVLDGVIDDGVLVFIVESFVRLQFVAENRRTGFHHRQEAKFPCTKTNTSGPAPASS